jgi:hypothetical protein
VLVVFEEDRIALLLREKNRYDFLGQDAVLLRARRLDLAVEGEQVLVGSG